MVSPLTASTTTASALEAPPSHWPTARRRSNHDRHLSLDEYSSSSSADEYDNEDDEIDEIDTVQIINGSAATADDNYGAGNDDENDDDPDEDRTTAIQTFLHILKGNVGPGCLSLPWATSVLGIPLSLLTLLSLCVITSFNCWTMVRWKRNYASDRRDVSYADLGEIAYGPRFRAYVLCCVCITQLCVCTVFFSFIGENIAAVMKAGGVPFLDDHRVVISMVLPLAMLLSCAPNLRVLAPATACGMVLLLLAFGCIGIIIGRNWDARDHTNLPQMGDWNEVPLAMCAFLYSFEAINLVLPIEAAMQEPKHFDCVFFLGMATVTTIYAIFAVLCVTAFGTIDDGSVSAFLEDHSEEFSARRLVLAANFVVSLSVLVTYPLQLFPAINLISQLRDRNAHPHHDSQPVPQSTPNDDGDGNGNGNNNNKMETYDDGLDDSHEGTTSTALGTFLPLDVEGERLENELGDEDSHFTKQDGSGWCCGVLFQNRRTFQGDSPILRASLVVGTYLVAILIPNVQELISLSGAFAGSSCALIIPPLLELRSILENHHRLSPMAVLRYMLLVIGVLFLIVGTAASIRDIVKAFEEGGDQ